MKSLVIEFGDNGAARLLPESVDGFHAVTQAALVNLLTSENTDSVYDTRGTGLLARLVGGGIYDLRSAGHAASFAAADTLFFSRETCVAAEDDRLDDIKLVPEFANNQLSLLASFVSLDGRVLSQPLYNNP